VSRSTLGQDLLAMDMRVLDRTMWAEWPGVEFDIRRADAADPLAGAIRVRAQDAAISRAKPVRIGGVDVPVVTAADLLLLELYAGGSQDKWDIEQLLAAHPIADLRAQVDSRLGALPQRSRDLWSTMVR
jgi:hypothetical protein